MNIRRAGAFILLGIFLCLVATSYIGREMLPRVWNVEHHHGVLEITGTNFANINAVYVNGQRTTDFTRHGLSEDAGFNVYLPREQIYDGILEVNVVNRTVPFAPARSNTATVALNYGDLIVESQTVSGNRMMKMLHMTRVLRSVMTEDTITVFAGRSQNASYFTLDVHDVFTDFGLNLTPHGHNGFQFFSIMDGNTVYREEKTEQNWETSLEFEGIVEGIPIHVEISPFLEDYWSNGVADITVHGVRYALLPHGLNVVVIDRETGVVREAMSFMISDPALQMFMRSMILEHPDVAAERLAASRALAE